ncbi:hypothetical protein BB560_000557 [Smittium megazygosporum]|uniref:Peptidase M16 N-terminal domain-containing protein n=1 Tax=Smittium megazygosporum TaxID=133381 RepID=A0A2T9ZK26_9FUNG|nr:hypothetical protein BB560_000557 [Smittium megazygosporum]
MDWAISSDFFSIEKVFSIESSSSGTLFPAISLLEQDSSLRVVISRTPGPLCELSILVPTLAENDKGLPHTLEHLIFCGSKNFPIRGYLDAKASINLSEGTNAYTAPDHTLYTLTTAGEEALLNTLPAFLDGVLNPLLSDDQFITEVYHYDENGKEGGVVFSEMSSVENTEYGLKQRELIYGPDSPYAKNFGGHTSAIRQLSIEEIRAYHQKLYRPNRISILIVGSVSFNLDKLVSTFKDNFSIFGDFQKENKIANPDMKVYSINPRLNINEIKFPSDDVEIGSISFVSAFLSAFMKKYKVSNFLNLKIFLGWKGPSLKDSKTRFALSILFEYLTENVSSPLNQRFVEIPNPMASSIGAEIENYEPNSIILTFSGVPYKSDDHSVSKYYNSDYFYKILMEELQKICDSGFTTASYSILDVIKRFLREMNSEMELSPVDEVNQILVSKVLEEFYCLDTGNSKNIKSRKVPFSESIISSFTIVKQLIEEPISFWKDILDKWILNSECVLVKMIPDSQMGIELEKASNEFQKSKVSDLTEVDRTKLRNRIATAALSFESDIFFPNNQANNVYDFCKMQPMAPGNRVDYKTATTKLSEILVSYDMWVGNSEGSFTCYPPIDLLTFYAKSEPQKMNEAINLFFLSFIFMDFTPSRVLSASKKLLSHLLECKRDGYFLLHSITTKLISSKPLSSSESDNRLKGKNGGSEPVDLAVNIFKQEKFIKKVLSALKGSSDNDVDTDDSNDYDSSSSSDSETDEIHSTLTNGSLGPSKENNQELYTVLSKSGPRNSISRLDSISAPDEIDGGEFDVSFILESLKNIKDYIINLFEGDLSQIKGFIQLGVPSNFNIDTDTMITKIVDSWAKLSFVYNSSNKGDNSGSVVLQDGCTLNVPINKILQNPAGDNPFFVDTDNFSNQSKPFPFPYKPIFNFSLPKNTLSESRTVIVPAPSLCSSFSLLMANCADVTGYLDIKSLSNPSLAELEESSLRILTELFSRTDGILYNTVRGKGYAYGAYATYSQLRKRLSINCHDATDVKSAILEIRNVLTQLRDDLDFWDKQVSDFEISVAKSSILYSEFAKISTPNSIFSLSTLANLRGFFDINSYTSYSNELISKVTKESLRHAFLRHFTRLIQTQENSITVIVTPPLELKEDRKNMLKNYSPDPEFTIIRLSELASD